MFVVVFYIYPLKFMFSAVIGQLLGLVWIAIALLAIAISWLGGPRWVPIAGFSYALLGPAQALNGMVNGKRANRAREAAGTV